MTTESKGRRRARTAGMFGALAGVAAAGVAGGIALERLVLRRGRQQQDDPYADEPFDQLPTDGELTVTTEDGVDLHVEIVEPPGDGPPDLTVIFVHGFALDMGTFHFQRRELTGLTEPRLRLICYDQPGHGQSGRLAAGEYTIDALGAALYRVIEEVAADGPLVLVSHSMGGMTVMALAEQHPELFAPAPERRRRRRADPTGRVRAVAFICTSAGRLADVTFGMPRFLAQARQRLLLVLTGAAKLTPAMIDQARGAATDVAHMLTRRFGFAGRNPSRSLVSYVERMNARTSIEVIAGFLGTLFEHARYTALAALAQTDVLVVAGDSDLFTPLSHSEEIVKLLPDAELVVIPEAGHVALLEYPEVVNAALRKLLDKAAQRDKPTRRP
jgi:pimeloyl-ACP methyl ester carboxylesterase